MITRRKLLYWSLMRLLIPLIVLDNVQSHLDATWRRYRWIARTRTRKDFLKHILWKTHMNQKDIDSAFGRWLTHTRGEPVFAAIKEAKETAALSLERSDLCPYCKGGMRRTIAAGHSVYVCDSDRHVTPVENDKL